MKISKVCLSSKGIALVLVLGFLVLVSGIVLAFFSSVQTDLQSSKAYASSATVKQLADTSVNIVMGQIIDGSKTFEIPGRPGQKGSGRRLTWISQPGLISTFDDEGAAQRAFKLYSALNMVAKPDDRDGRYGPFGYDVLKDTKFEIPKEWTKQTALFTDLNKPVLVPDSDGVLEINKQTYTPNFPILDPSAVGAVEGFKLNTALIPGYVANANPTISGANPAAMPVRWLYVLADGTVTAPKASSQDAALADWPTSAEIPDEIRPSAANPIVGRIAFWTDDESSKVNINTASEGTFWDRPWLNTTQEQLLAERIPAFDEFQRFQGHPATVCMSTLLGSLLKSPNGFVGTAPYPPVAITKQNYAQLLTPYYALAPRVGEGGTKGGTETNVQQKPMVLDYDRLYSSIDELMFTPGLAGEFREESSKKAGKTLDNKLIEKLKFFATTSSRAPEVNLFSRPRITLWPLQITPTKRNAKDKLIAFCSEIGGRKYYFQRFSEDKGSSQSPVQDLDGVPRNIELYTYLQNLTDLKIPGFGNSFKNKYPGERDQILTQMVDLIRSGLNSANNAFGANEKYSYVPGPDVSGAGQVVPLSPTSGMPGSGTRGFGRFATITEAALIFYCSKGAVAKVAGKPDSWVPEKMKAALVLEPFLPSPGVPAFTANVKYVVEGLENLRVTAGGAQQSLFTGGAKENLVTGRSKFTVNAYDGLITPADAVSFTGLHAAFRHQSGNADAAKTVGPNPRTQYPFASLQEIDLKTANGKFKFHGGSIRILIKTESDVTSQELTMTFPAIPGDLPVPTVNDLGKQQFVDFGLRLNSRDARAIIQKGDVVRSMEVEHDGPSKGDLRMVAALANVPAEYFTKSNKPPGYKSLPSHLQQYENVALRTVHGLRSGHWTAQGQFGFDRKLPGAGIGDGNSPQNVGTNDYMNTEITAGLVIPFNLLPSGEEGQGYRRDADPAVARDTPSAMLLARDGTTALPGDWDNMTGSIEDGAYINKPDEGNSETKKMVEYLGREVTGGYYSRGGFTEPGNKTFSPNRQVASAIMFGSLPTGINPTDALNPKPWRTLLFCANPAAGKDPNPDGRKEHPGFGTRAKGGAYQTVPDHVILDLFTMPIVEPYAISEPFSTAGKINMNFQIAPFTYINRSTAVRAAMKSTQILAIPTSGASNGGPSSYKEGTPYGNEVRYDLNLDADETNKGTLKAFHDRFTVGNLFRSASEICEIMLLPKRRAGKTYGSPADPVTATAATVWWNSHRITGDNTREIPYGNIYSKLTTRSNTFTVHMRVQALRKSQPSSSLTKSLKDAAWAKWDENKDQVLSEYRGSTTIERYIDPSDPNLPDFARDPSATMDDHYKFRVISSKRFAP